MNRSQQPSASLPNSTSNLPTQETVVSIVHHTNKKTQQNDELAVYETTENHEPETPIEKQWLEQLLTPWGISSLLILLLANMLLSWAQWSTEKQEAQTSFESNQTSQQLSSSKSINLTPEKSSKIALNRLSVLPSPAKSVTPTVTSSKNSKTVAKTAKSHQSVAPKNKANLTNALLPPSLQPQLIQTSSPPPNPSVSQVAVKPISQPQTVTASPKSAPVEPTKPNQEPQTQILEEQRVFEQIRAREQQPAPLGFNHQTRAKLRSAEHQQAPTELMDQLQQIQQQKIDEVTDKPTP